MKIGKSNLITVKMYHANMLLIAQTLYQKAKDGGVNFKSRHLKRLESNLQRKFECEGLSDLFHLIYDQTLEITPDKNNIQAKDPIRELVYGPNILLNMIRKEVK